MRPVHSMPHIPHAPCTCRNVPTTLRLAPVVRTAAASSGSSMCRRSIIRAAAISTGAATNPQMIAAHGSITAHLRRPQQ
eukprot:2257342-Pyramimonas_sp.AAC.1